MHESHSVGMLDYKIDKISLLYPRCHFYNLLQVHLHIIVA
jgi:hypothetical protein